MRIGVAIKAMRDSDLVDFEPGVPVTDFAELVSSIEPHFGKIDWAPPETYRDALALGAFSAYRDDAAAGMKIGFALLSAEDIPGVNQDLVHMPEGVSRDEGVTLSTNHLIGFADAGGEAVWCFDVTGGSGADYPVYYHHQDKPRARVVETGAWENAADAMPDFASFADWLDAMSAALTAKPTDVPPWFHHLGEPSVTFRSES